MNILAQIIRENHQDNYSTELKQVLEKLVSPLQQNPGLKNYVEMVEALDKSSRKLIINLMRETLERMDREYRNSPGRKNNFYVKQTRNRTTITVFGDLTYKRTEYVDKRTKKPFCYVDRKLGLRKKERYDPCVQALIIELYADSNSMIKVGKLVGDRISGSFNCRKGRDNAISRQTVYNVLHRFSCITAPLTPREKTPETLYIMADEKYLALQKEEVKSKAMTKAAVIFEGLQAVVKKDGNPTKRKSLVNKTTVLQAEGSIWERINEVLYQIYDMDQVKQLYVMGDGAGWLVRGYSEVKPPNGKTTFALDRFHFKQAINRISTDEGLRKMMYEYAYHNMKKDFIELVNTIKESNSERVETIEENLAYLLKHWGHYQAMNKVVKIGCSMEAAISHVVASVFSSVPKAYSRENLPLYFNYRELQQNSCDFRNIILQAMSLQKQNEKDVTISPQEFDFSIFEKKVYPDNPTIREFNKNIITPF